MAFCSIFHLFVIFFFIIQCSERITAETSSVTDRSKKENIDLLQLINQETLIRFELDKNVRKMNAKVETFTIDNKLASDRFNQEMQSINTTLSGLRKNQDETNEAVITVKASTDSEIRLLKEEIKSMKQKLVNLEHNQQKLKTDLVRAKSQNALEVESLKTYQKELILNVTGLFEGSKRKISFSAVMTSLKSSYSSSETVIFPKILTNIGSAYNNSTGVFTSPTEGTFVFYYSTYTYTIGAQRINLVLNGQTMVYFYAYDSSDSVQQSSSLVVLHLRSGDEVWIKHTYGVGIYADAYRMPIFSGFML